MTVKEQVVEAIRAEGFDYWTACEEYERVRRDVLKSGKRQTWYVGATRIVLEPKK